jgi:hypothetical protein
METITIQVDTEVAQAYREANPTERQKIQMLVNTWLKQAMKRRSLDEIIGEIQTQASAQGLTQDILDQMLKNG